MNQFSIRDIENLTGIKAHTLRIWEQRYGLICPKRKASLHRYYDNDDLKLILRVIYLYNKGVKISHIARMSEDQIRQLALEGQFVPPDRSAFINRMIEASLDFSGPAFESALVEAIAAFGLEAAFLEVVFPFLRKIGLLWLTGHVLPAQEHFASTIISRFLICEIEQLSRVAGTRSGVTLLFSPPGEFHEIPLLFMQYLLKKRKKATVYAGINVGEECLKLLARKQPINRLYLGLITHLNRCNIYEYLDRLKSHFPEKPVYCATTLINNPERLAPGIHILFSEKEVLEFAG